MGKQEYIPKTITINDPEEGAEYEFLEVDRVQCEEGQFIAVMALSEEIRKLNDNVLVLRIIEENGSTQLQTIEDDDLRLKVSMLIEKHLTETYELPEDL